ncbi:SseB family protein [Canibacter sp. lx-45]|uniref:SseB family protein n=1 Tax=Canibacter zhuwentaonis TaxID=2837491 RepID=UPI001BDDC799|nr:SseB family protein [Canibacter zhuwentaonis]MBT1035086.1 SseB family protein [Canibacter zhuwentaonis]
MAIRKLRSTGDIPQNSKTRSGLPEGILPGGLADSAGIAWAGRTFDHHNTAFADDDGLAYPQYTEAVAILRAAAQRYRDKQLSGDAQQISASFQELLKAQQKVLRALQEVRVLVPLIAQAGDFGTIATGKTVEKTQELSIVTVLAPDGRKALPVFSSTAAMREWDSSARPIPVMMPQVMLAAAQENSEMVIVDPASKTSELGIRQNQYEAVATGADFTPAWAQPEIAERVNKLLISDSVLVVALLPADPELRLISAETELVLGLRPGLSNGEVTTIVDNAKQAWQREETLVSAVDSLKIRVVSL